MRAFAPLCMLLLIGCRTIDDDRHWGSYGRHWGPHHRHHYHDRAYRHPPPHYRPLAPPVFHPPHLPPQPAYREPRSGAGRDHGGRPWHRGGRDHGRKH